MRLAPPGLPGRRVKPGVSWSPAVYVGSEACQECHGELYETYAESGHAHALTKIVDGKEPEFPFSELPGPPEGHTWDDILYVIGGFGWKANFVTQDGTLLTGDGTQYNLENNNLDLGDEWVAYHSGEEVPFDCVKCHTTGYVPDGHQDDVAGVIGTWAEDNVGCEECHGPGGNHVNDPYFVEMKIDRDSELCGECHTRGDPGSLGVTADGFLDHNNQYGELFTSTKRVMNCVDCHNPHSTTHYAKGLAIKTECETCHFDKAENQKINDRRHARCTDCHMPYATESAIGDPTQHAADVRTHLMAFNPQASSQYTRDGEAFEPYLTIEFTCKSCHYDRGVGGPLPDDQLTEVATGFHDPAQAGSLNRQR